jgi:hypothetical protein
MTYQLVQTYTKRSNSIKTTSTKLAGKRDSSLKMHVFLCSQMRQATRTTSESKAFHFLFLICFLACSHQFTTSVSWNWRGATRCQENLLRGLNQTSLLTPQRTSKCSIVSSSWEQRAHGLWFGKPWCSREAPQRPSKASQKNILQLLGTRVLQSCFALANADWPTNRVWYADRSPTPTDQQTESGTLMPVTPQCWTHVMSC